MLVAVRSLPPSDLRRRPTDSAILARRASPGALILWTAMLLGLVLVAPPTAGASTPAWRATSYLATSPLAARLASCPDAGLCVVVGGP